MSQKSGMMIKDIMTSQFLTPNSEAAILARILESDERELTPDAARYLLSMKLPPLGSRPRRCSVRESARWFAHSK